eukprot:TRINITY_DN853_c0_g3_i1.p1 TRINITY_DN853_c0_g3~~TRINITY_DN853_c0_g3_i1.p1  ORF type:complete len:272 (-),score=59.51 TRINITY_DN853_c0_g3_i1:286-1101(-)
MVATKALMIAASIAASLAGFCDTQTGWKQVWSDEFHGPTIDTTKWNVRVGVNYNSYSREASLSADNVYISNGQLVLRTQRQADCGFNYTSGAVDSQKKSSWLGGRACVMAKLPGGGSNPLAGTGIWPAHWMLPDDGTCWPDHGEIDIMEMINGDGTLHGTYHWSKLFPQQKCQYAKGNIGEGGMTKLPDDWATNFHEYAVEWDDKHMTFVIDGKPYFSVNSSVTPAPQYPPAPMYMILNTAIGGGWPKEPDQNTVLPTYHIIEYVRIAQQA